MRLRAVASGLALGALLPLAGAGWVALRAAQLEERTFSPLRAPLVPPSDLALQPATFSSRDGTALRGWYLPGATSAAVVLVHGTGSDRSALLPEAHALAAQGLGVLLFDLPGHGESGGAVDWGRPSRDALEGALDFLGAQPGVAPDRLGALGFSWGSAVVAQVAAADPRIRAVALTGAFDTVEAQLRFEFDRYGALTELPALWAARRGGLWEAADDPARVIGGLAPRPVLLVAGDADQAVTAEQTERLYLAAREPKQLLVIRGAGHGGYDRAGGAAYRQALAQFFAASLAPPTRDPRRDPAQYLPTGNDEVQREHRPESRRHGHHPDLPQAGAAARSAPECTRAGACQPRGAGPGR